MKVISLFSKRLVWGKCRLNYFWGKRVERGNCWRRRIKSSCYVIICCLFWNLVTIIIAFVPVRVYTLKLWEKITFYHFSKKGLFRFFLHVEAQLSLKNAWLPPVFFLDFNSPWYDLLVSHSHHLGKSTSHSWAPSLTDGPAGLLEFSFFAGSQTFPLVYWRVFFSRVFTRSRLFAFFLFSRVYKWFRLFIEGFYFRGLTEGPICLLGLIFLSDNRELAFWSLLSPWVNNRSRLFLFWAFIVYMQF